jgi:hypothetical protein
MLLLPSVIRANVPYAFIVSANPLTLNISEEYPHIGSDAGLDEKDKIKEFRKEFEPYLEHLKKLTKENFKLAGVELDENLILHKPISKYFSIYCYPKELDYYTDEIKKGI